MRNPGGLIRGLRKSLHCSSGGSSEVLSISLRRKISRDRYVPGTALIKQPLGMDVSTEIVVSYRNVLGRLGGKSRIRSRWRGSKNHSVRLCFVRLIIEASVA